MRAIRKGKFQNIAQTNRFLARVKSLKELVDAVLLNAETHNVYLPNYITAAQRHIPLRGENVLGYQGDGLRPMPSSWRKAIIGDYNTSTTGGKVIESRGF